MSILTNKHIYTHTHTLLLTACLIFGASLVAQMVRNLPAMRETWVQSLGQEDPLEEGMATHSSILAWGIPMDRGVWRAIYSMGLQTVGQD